MVTKLSGAFIVFSFVFTLHEAFGVGWRTAEYAVLAVVTVAVYGGAPWSAYQRAK